MHDGLRRNAWKFPIKVAAKDKFRETTYGELNARVNQLAKGLLSLGVRKGDGVALSVGNRIEHLEIIFATAKIGALAIPFDVKWKALELASVVAALEPSFVVLQEDCAAEFEKAKALKDLASIRSISLSADRSYSGLLSGEASQEPEVPVDEDDPFADERPVWVAALRAFRPEGVVARPAEHLRERVARAEELAVPFALGEVGAGDHPVLLCEPSPEADSPSHFGHGQEANPSHVSHHEPHFWQREKNVVRAS